MGRCGSTGVRTTGLLPRVRRGVAVLRHTGKRCGAPLPCRPPPARDPGRPAGAASVGLRSKTPDCAGAASRHDAPNPDTDPAPHITTAIEALLGKGVAVVAGDPLAQHPLWATPTSAGTATPGWCLNADLFHMIGG
eukprot:gene6382-biopygen4058